MAGSPMALLAASGKESGAATRFGFEEIAHSVDETHHVAPGYSTAVLMRWGDPVLPGAPGFDPYEQSAEAQTQQFGYNNDFIGYVLLPFGSNNPDHGLLCINHEYTNEEVMFPGLGKYDKGRSGVTKEIVDIEMACHGSSIIEIRKNQGRWQVVKDSRYEYRKHKRPASQVGQVSTGLQVAVNPPFDGLSG